MHKRWAAWFIPDLGLVISFITLLYSVLLFDGPWKFFRDSDTGWHIRTGEWILTASALPRTDPYSFSRGGQPWFAWEWGSDVLMGAAHMHDGLPGVALLYAAAIGLCTWIWFRLHWALQGDFFIACIMAVPMLSTVNLHWLARPHVFSWALLLLTLWAVERGVELRASPERSPYPRLAAAFLMGAVWANLHASFLMLPGILMLYSFSHLVRPFIWSLDSRQELRMAGVFLSLSLAALAGTLMNPYGWNLHAHVLAYLGDAALLDQVGEFQSFNFHSSGSWQILIALGLSIAGGVLALTQAKVANFLLAVALCALALRSARALPLMAMALLPLANGAISQALRTSALRSRFATRLRAFLEYSSRLRMLDAPFHGGALVAVALLLLGAYLNLPAVAAQTGFPPNEFPVKAAASVAALPPGARLLAPDKFGGYLIYRFNGRIKVFCDGRSDLYGAAFMNGYIRLMQVRPGWERQIEVFGFTHALLPNDYSLLSVLPRLGWKQLYRDNVVTLLERP